MEAELDIDLAAQAQRAGVRSSALAERTRPSKRWWRDSLLRRMLAAADVSAVVVTAGLLAVARPVGFTQFGLMVAMGPAWVIIGKLVGLYDLDQRSLRHLTTDELPLLATWSACGVGATSLVLHATSAAFSVPTSVGVLVCVFLADSILRGTARFAWRRVVPAERTSLIAGDPLASATLRKLEIFKDINIEVVERRDAADLEQLTQDYAWLKEIDRVIVASPMLDERRLRALLYRCQRDGVKFSVVPPPCFVMGTAVALNYIAELPIVEYHTGDVPRSTLLMKRVIDVCLSAALLIALVPLLALVALAIKLDSPGSALFCQRRVGQGGRLFWMLKFRTMVADAEERLEQLVKLDDLAEPVFKFRCDPRVTRVGRFLRRTSIDELPQLINVFLGQMSMVGPRPEQVELVQRYEPSHLFRLSVKPGLTGPMQVYGRGALSFEERLAVDRDYIDNLSLARDLRLIAMTIPAMLAGRGAY